MRPVASGPAWRQTWSFKSIGEVLPLRVGALGEVDGFEVEGFLVASLG